LKHETGIAVNMQKNDERKTIEDAIHQRIVIDAIARLG